MPCSDKWPVFAVAACFYILLHVCHDMLRYLESELYNIDKYKRHIMKIGIFCSANTSIDPDFFSMTEEFGRWIARNGHSIVFGGCNLGLMECVARTVHEAGGLCIGAVPSIIEKNGRVSDYTDVRIMCDSLSDRKEIMLAKSDVIVALPGGVGTLDEIFTVLASASIGYHSKRVVLYNMKGFWNPLVKMLSDMKSTGVIRNDFDSHLLVAACFDELVSLLS